MKILSGDSSGAIKPKLQQHTPPPQVPFKETLEGGQADVVKNKAVAQQPAHEQHRNKIDVPHDFEPRAGLSQEEQAYFEQLFPKARREIKAYVNQQRKQFPAKGSLIDIKG